MAVPQKIVLKSTTKMSLNDRFSAISAQPRPVQNIRTKMAVAAQASAKNKRLAQQMANRPTVQAALKIKQRSLQQRLGTSNVKSRLTLGPRGRGRGGPMANRLGTPNTARGGFVGRGRARGRGGVPRGNITRGRGMTRGGRQQRGGQRGAFRGGIANRFPDGPRGRGGWRGRGRGFPDQIRGSTRGRGRGTRARGGRGQGRGRGAPGRGRGGAAPSREALDSQLDTYMSKTKSNLDVELDSYMSQTDM